MKQRGSPVFDRGRKTLSLFFSLKHRTEAGLFQLKGQTGRKEVSCVNKVWQSEWEEYFDYLYRTAAVKYGDCPDIDSLVSDSMLAFIEKTGRGESVEHPKAYLDAILKNKHNAYLREKYKNSISYYDCVDIPCETEEDQDHSEEVYTSVRRELGRLVFIYREAALRYYMHGQSVGQIAKELGISEGTVKSRLSAARSKMKEGLEKMEKYSRESYELKRVTLGIWGYGGLCGEPFNLVGEIEGNILALAYERPVSVQSISDSLGIPCPYIETIINKLVDGELLGRSSGGLVYTRCFVQKYSQSFGDIKRQEKLADEYAVKIYSLCEPYLRHFEKTGSFAEMSEKQKGTLYLFLILRAVNRAVRLCTGKVTNTDKIEYPERKNGGKWLATLTVREHYEKTLPRYETSGVLSVKYQKDKVNTTCEMLDLQSVFGDTHWGYPKMKYKASNIDILRFYASLLECDVSCEFDRMPELAPDFERLGIIGRDAHGRVRLDIPSLTYEELGEACGILKEMYDAVYGLLSEPLTKLILEYNIAVPGHVDGRGHFTKHGAAGAYVIAQLIKIAEQGLMPYHVEIGKTPLILVKYKKR